MGTKLSAHRLPVCVKCTPGIYPEPRPRLAGHAGQRDAGIHVCSEHGSGTLTRSLPLSACFPRSVNLNAAPGAPRRQTPPSSWGAEGREGVLPHVPRAHKNGYCGKDRKRPVPWTMWDVGRLVRAPWVGTENGAAAGESVSVEMPQKTRNRATSEPAPLPSTVNERSPPPSANGSPQSGVR